MESAGTPTARPDPPPLVAGLLDPAAYPHPTGRIRLVETHISWLLLTGRYVYKVKKPCDLGFLDFTTLERREHFCREEVRVSGRFAPALYLGVVPISGTPAAPRVDGGGPPIEWAVRLVQFDENLRLDRLLEQGRIDAAACERLGAEIARLHAGLAVADAGQGWGSAETLLGAADVVLERLRSCQPVMAPRVDVIIGWLHESVATARPLIAERAAAGCIRECHGDLHLANIVLHDGRMTPFDAIEFSPALRWIDVANDVAFLAMDLRARGRGDLAAHVVNGWCEAADDRGGLRVMRIYEVYRAIVRASVAAIRCGQASGSEAIGAAAESERYLAIAERLIAPRSPVLFATCGVSGSGKTTFTDKMVGAHDAVRLRSDVERKRLAGMPPTGRPADATAAESLYGPAMTRRVYERLASLAETMLAGGTNVVVDAACTLREQRAMLAAAARAAAVPQVWVEFVVPTDEAEARVAVRRAAGHDASDATPEVVRRQFAIHEPITEQERTTEHVRVVTVSGPAPEAARAAEAGVAQAVRELCGSAATRA